MKKTKKTKQSEKKIETALKYSDGIIATLREPFLVLNKNLRVVSTNQSFCAAFKVSKKETISRLLPDLGGRQWNIPKLIRLLKNILPKKRVVKNYEIEHNFKKIGNRIMNLNACQIRVPKEIANKIAAAAAAAEEELILLAIEDITERKLMEQSVQRARDYAESVIGTIREPLLVLNEELKVVSASRCFYQTFEVTPKETEGEFIYDLGNRQWDIPKLRQLLEKILPKKTKFDNFEVEHKFRKIGKRIMLLNARRIPPPPAQPERILLAIEDITERKKMQKKMLQATKLETELERQKEIDRMTAEFISVASHQLRTPLTGIQWVVERFLKKEKVSPKGKEYLGDIHETSCRLSNLVDLLLNVSRIEGGKVSISPGRLELVGFIESYLDECTALLDKKNITLVFKKHPKTLGAITDKSLIRNVVQSVVSNAIEYSLKRGKIEISLEKKEKNFLFTVKDRGIGIPKKEQAVIFDKFTRASNAKLTKTNGTGLGLYLAKQAAELLGGKIWFKSVKDKGSVFYIELPLKSRSKKSGKKIV